MPWNLSRLKMSLIEQRVTELSFASVVPWNGIVLDRVPFHKEKKMLYEWICPNSLITQVTPLHSSSTRNNKAVVAHLTEISQQWMQSVWCPHRTQDRSSKSLSWRGQRQPGKQLLVQPFSLITVLPNRGSAKVWGPLSRISSFQGWAWITGAR